MEKSILKLLIAKVKLQLQVLMIQYAIALSKQKLTVPNLKGPTKVILHHGGGWLDAEEVNTYHKHRWGFKSSLGYYMGYTKFIGRDGSLYIARRDNEEGAHTKGYNKRTIGIGLEGDGTVRDFTSAQYATLDRVVAEDMDKYGMKKTQLHGHFEFAATLCPSPYLKSWILKYKKAAV